jgi:hypothetical protein
MEAFALSTTKTPPNCAWSNRAAFKRHWNGRFKQEVHMTTRLAITSCLFLGIAMLLFPCSTALAELRGVVRACASDVKAQCAGVNPGEGRIRACIKTHLKDLSEPCQKLALKAAAGKACAADVKQNCAGTKPGRGRIQACMKDHLADVSESCKEALAGAAAGKD